MIPLAKAQAIAAHVAEALNPFCARLEIAGSIRRGKTEVGDIDLVLEVHDMAGLRARILERCRIMKNGEQYVVAMMPDGTQLDLWFAHVPGVTSAPKQGDFFGDRETKPFNFGSLLLARTGSMEHNIALASRAKLHGLHWNPHWGIYQGGVCIASETEQSIYAALGLPFLEPADRELADRLAQQRLIYAKESAAA